MKQIDEILAAAESRLSKAAPSLTKQLVALVAQPLPFGTSFVDFEVFPGGYRIGFYPMDDESTQLGFAYAVEEDLLPDKHYCPLEKHDDSSAQTQALVTAWEQRLNTIVIDWFRRCWTGAGTRGFGVPTYISIHDTNIVFDLLNDRYIDRDGEA